MGRKQLTKEEKKQMFATRVPKDIIEKIKKLAEKKKVSQAILIEEIVRSLFTPQK